MVKVLTGPADTSGMATNNTTNLPAPGDIMITPEMDGGGFDAEYRTEPIGIYYSIVTRVADGYVWHREIYMGANHTRIVGSEVGRDIRSF